MSTRWAWVLPALVMPPWRIAGAARVLRSHQAQVGHQLARIGEPGEIADLRGDRHCDDQADPTHRLHGLDHRRDRPGRQQFLNLALQALEPCLGILHCWDLALQDDVLGGVVGAQPVLMGLGPARTPRYVRTSSIHAGLLFRLAAEVRF
jgi:hypothetical protein